MARVARTAFVLVAAMLLGAVAPTNAAASRGGLVAGLTVSPLPGTHDASPRSQISLLGMAPAGILRVRVRGSHSGMHRGRLKPYSSGDGASFLPRRRFATGELVSVRITTSIQGRRRHGHFRFRVGRHANLVMPPIPPPPTSTRSTDSFLSRPDLHPPSISVSARADGRAPGYVFVTPILGPGNRPPMRGQFGPTIVDDQGQLVWLSPSPRGREAFNLRVQSYRGAPVLTWWEGRLSFLGLGFGKNVIADSSYRVIGEVRAGNGYHADLHDFTIDSRGSGWLTVYVPVLLTVHAHGHSHHVALLDSIVQRVDIPTGLVMFEWHSLGHIGLRESYLPRLQNGLPFDAFHVNSVEVDRAGNFLVSERNTWTVYLVSGSSGRILWRLGGKRSSFRLPRSARFAWQHDAHRQPDGTVTIFDNHASPRVGRESRGLVLALDPGHKRAQLVRQYTHPRPVVAGSQGTMQVLPNGNAFLGWGARPYISEFSRDGRLLFEASFPSSDESYRAYRFPWIGRPSTPPSVATRTRAGATTVYASWNGATEVGAWRVLAGASPDALQPVATAARAGFETAIPLGSPAAYVAVQALDSAGQVLGTSTAIKPS